VIASKQGRQCRLIGRILVSGRPHTGGIDRRNDRAVLFEVRIVLHQRLAAIGHTRLCSNRREKCRSVCNGRVQGRPQNFGRRLHAGRERNFGEGGTGDQSDTECIRFGKLCAFVAGCLLRAAMVSDALGSARHIENSQ